jgi:hypothetical protein
MGFVPVEEPSPRAGVFSHPETREYEFYLRFNEAEDVALTRLNTEKEEVKAILGSTSPSI